MEQNIVSIDIALLDHFDPQDQTVTPILMEVLEKIQLTLIQRTFRGQELVLLLLKFLKVLSGNKMACPSKMPTTIAAGYSMLVREGMNLRRAEIQTCLRNVLLLDIRLLLCFSEELSMTDWQGYDVQIAYLLECFRNCSELTPQICRLKGLLKILEVVICLARKQAPNLGDLLHCASLACFDDYSSFLLTHLLTQYLENDCSNGLQVLDLAICLLAHQQLR
jgi:hypothetical protein